MLVEELIARMGIDTSPYEKGLDEVHRKSQGFIATISGILKQGLSFATGMGVFQAMKAGFEATVKAGWQLNQTLNTARLGFITMMGSVDEANRHIREMTEFAARTPFQLEGLISASQQLQGMGIEANRVIPVLRAVGDALSASGKLSQDSVNRVVLALGQMSLRGKVASQEMLQLTEAGIPSWAILAEKMGVSTEQLQEMVSKGLVPAQAAIDALVVGLEERFGGAMDRVSKTAPGMWSTFKDNIQIFMAEAVRPLYDLWEGKLLPAMLRFSEWLQGLSFKDVIGKLQSFGGAWDLVKEVVSGAWAVLRAGVETARHILGDYVAWFQEHIWPVYQRIWGRISELVRWVLPDIVQFVVGVLNGLREFWDRFWPPIAQVLADVWAAIGWIVENALTVIFGVIKAALRILSGDWAGAWEAIKEMFRSVWESIAGIAERLWTEIKERFYKWLGDLIDGVRPFLRILPDSWERMIDEFRATVQKKEIQLMMKQVFEESKETVSTNMQAAGTSVEEFSKQVAHAAGATKPALEGMSGNFDKLGKSAEDASQKIAKLAEQARSYFTSRYQEAMPAVQAGLITIGQAQEYARSAVTQQYGAEALKALWEQTKATYYAATPERQREMFRWLYGVEPPGLQAGGIVTRPGIYQLAEGGPEAVIPLNRMPAQVTINITGNHIASDYDVDRIGELIVRKLRLAGVLT